MINGIRTLAHSSRSSAALRNLSSVARATSSVSRPSRILGAPNPASSILQALKRSKAQPQYRCFSDEDKKEEKGTADKAEEEVKEEPEKQGEVSEASPEEKLQAEVKALRDQLLRSLAEQENTRTIARKDVDSARNFAIKSFAKSLLEVSDNLQRALGSVDESELETNKALSNLHEGIKMTNDGLAKAFQSNGVTKYCEEPGDSFDPESMNALMEYPDPSKESGTVGQVIKAGFMLNQRVLRPAEVGVVKKT